MAKNDITIVTAFFDIGRGNLPNEKHGRVLPFYQHRTVDSYFEFFNNLAKAKNEMIIYTTPNFKDRILAIRESHGLLDKTQVVTMEDYLPPGWSDVKNKIQKIMDDPNYYGKVVNPQLIEYWHVDYVLVNILKAIYVSHAISVGLVKTPLTAWIDFGYCRALDTIPFGRELWQYSFDPEKIHLFNIRDIDPARPIESIIYTGDVYIMGCHIVAGTKKWKDFANMMVKSLTMLLEHNLIDDDQTFLLLSYEFNRTKCELHYVDPSDWFIIFKYWNEN